MNDRPTLDFSEQATSQIPAIRLLATMGWKLMSPAEADLQRNGRRSQVLLNRVLKDWLANNNEIEWKNTREPFSSANLELAVRKLTDAPFAGLLPANADLTDRLLLGTTLTQSVAGDTKSFPCRYINWQEPEKNVFHMVPEYAVARSGRDNHCFIDLVLFVNGIPLATIECKKPDAATKSTSAVDMAVEQTIRNAGAAYVPRLFGFIQVVLGLAHSEAKYATAGTPRRYWAVWRERNVQSSGLAEAVALPAPELAIETLRNIPDFNGIADQIDELMRSQRLPTAQDEALFGLCRPDRLLRIANRYTLFDGVIKKVARYQQFFCVERLLQRIQTRNPDGSRKGGVVWHTQGSGKSLTMVMFARGLAEELPRKGSARFKIVLVTDRVDLDEQIGKTFASCGQIPVRASTGANLAELLEDTKARVITTVINKFEAAGNVRGAIDDTDVFVIVDEGHRTQFGLLNAKMQKKLPRACLIAFTGTPVQQKERSTIEEFGGLIDSYTIQQANEDNAVVPLLYEGREVPQDVDNMRLDEWFARITEDLSEQQTRDLKKKFARSSILNSADQRIMMVAYDVAQHFKALFRGTGFKGQLVAPNKACAIRYHRYLTEAGVSSEVLISPPDDREGEDGELIDNEEKKAEVRRFWQRAMERFGDPEKYQKELIRTFSAGGDPEILVVVHKLLTGFDAPRNSVLYLARKLEEHNLLQAIARVNRLHEDKDEGLIIDYVGVIKALDEAIRKYSDVDGFDANDLQGVVSSVTEQIGRLPGLHDDLWRMFAAIQDSGDLEAFERSLADQADRDRFYALLSDYTRTLGLGLASVTFHESTAPKKIVTYKNDLKFFQVLRGNVKRRYQEEVAFGEYETRILRLIDKHVGAGEVELVVPQIPLFDESRREAELERLGSDAAKADAIASQMDRTIREKWDEDPAFYRRFSEMLSEVIAEWRAERMSDAAYLERVRGLLRPLQSGADDLGPDNFRDREIARAYFGVVSELVDSAVDSNCEFAVRVADGIDMIIGDSPPVDWTKNDDYLNQVRQEIDDLLFELKDKFNVILTLDQSDDIAERCLEIAKRRLGIQ